MRSTLLYRSPRGRIDDDDGDDGYPICHRLFTADPPPLIRLGEAVFKQKLKELKAGLLRAALRNVYSHTGFLAHGLAPPDPLLRESAEGGEARPQPGHDHRGGSVFREVEGSTGQADRQLLVAQERIVVVGVQADDEVGAQPATLLAARGLPVQDHDHQFHVVLLFF
eukprot:gene107-biopygen98